MNTQTNRYDEMTESELYIEALSRDWNIGNTAVSSHGVTLTLRKHYTSDAPGVETRTVSGDDDADALRTFLVQLDEQQAG